MVVFKRSGEKKSFLKKGGVMKKNILKGLSVLTFMVISWYLFTLWFDGLEFRRMILFILIAEAFIWAIRGIDMLAYPQSESEVMLHSQRMQYYRKFGGLRLCGHVIFMGMSALLIIGLNFAITGMMICSLILLALVFIVFITGN